MLTPCAQTAAAPKPSDSTRVRRKRVAENRTNQRWRDMPGSLLDRAGERGGAYGEARLLPPAFIIENRSARVKAGAVGVPRSIIKNADAARKFPSEKEKPDARLTY